MALCYLYPENEQDAHTQFQNEHSNEMPDGTGVKTHGTQRLCWPGSKSRYIRPSIPRI